MKLYYSPFACSLAAHIACREAGVQVDLVRVDLATKRTESGADLFAENPMGQVPTLVLDDGHVLTENVAVLSYLAARSTHPSTDPDPMSGYELTRWLSFVSTEVHKKILWPIFAPSSPEAVKEYARASAAPVLGVLAARLESRDTLLGGDFTVADAYLFWALTLTRHAGVTLEPFPAVRRFYRAHRARPAVHEALAFESAFLTARPS